MSSGLLNILEFLRKRDVFVFLWKNALEFLQGKCVSSRSWANYTIKCGCYNELSFHVAYLLQSRMKQRRNCPDKTGPEIERLPRKHTMQREPPKQNRSIPSDCLRHAFVVHTHTGSCFEEHLVANVVVLLLLVCIKMYRAAALFCVGNWVYNCEN